MTRRSTASPSWFAEAAHAPRRPLRHRPPSPSRDDEGGARGRRGFRAAFTRWFIYLAESQYYAPVLPPEINDCAALLRYGYRNALHAHDAAWLEQTGMAAFGTGSVEKYAYPHTPLGALLFRVKPKSGETEIESAQAVPPNKDAPKNFRLSIIAARPPSSHLQTYRNGNVHRALP